MNGGKSYQSPKKTRCTGFLSFLGITLKHLLLNNIWRVWRVFFKKGTCCTYHDLTIFYHDLAIFIMT